KIGTPSFNLFRRLSRTVADHHMPPLRSDLLETLIGSETTAELLMYSHDNPDTTDTVEGIAAKIRRSTKEIERDVSDLVELGLLQEVRIISFNKDRDQELQNAISQRPESAGSFEETSTTSNTDLTGVGTTES